MSDLFKGVASIKNRVLADKVGYIRALLADIPNEGTGLEYDEWLGLVSLLKFEVNDDEIAFDLFDEFSQRSDDYEEGFTYTKFHDAQMEGTGQVTLGTLVFIAQRDIPDFDRSKYAKFFGTEEITKLEKFAKKIAKNKNKMPDHVLFDGVTQMDLPDIRIDPMLTLPIIFDEGKTYGTAHHPAQVSIIDPYNGGELQQYITVNPIKDNREKVDPENPWKGIRNLEAVTNHKYAVIEFDTISLDEQWSVLQAVDLPYETLVFTGNKSIHAWIRIDAPDRETYKKRTRLINKMFEDFGYSKKNGKGIDTAVLYDSSSLVRCPGIIRSSFSSAKTAGEGNEQKALWAGESEGWDAWYKGTYMSYVVESSLEDVEEEFVIPEKDRNFGRKKKRIDEILGNEDYCQEIIDILSNQEPDSIVPTMNMIIPEFFNNIVNKSNRKLIPEVSDLYYLLVDAVLEGGCDYQGNLCEALYRSCKIYENYEAERRKELKEKLESTFESIMGQINEYVDPTLLIEIERALEIAEKNEKPDDHEKMVRSIERMFEDLTYRPAILQSAEVFKYAPKVGKMLADEFVRKDHVCSGALYVYYEKLHAFVRHSKSLIEVDTSTFPSHVSPFLAFVKRSKEGFGVVPLDNDSSNKLLKSYWFLQELRTLELISDVPIFKETDDGAELITGYDEDKKALITGDCTGYGFMDLGEAKEIIVELFDDFSFVDRSDLSRAVGSLLTPALCHAGLLNGDYRPACYIDADGAASGKGTMANILTIPYTDTPAFVTQDDSSVGSIDDKVGGAIIEGQNLIIIDNLKPTRKMKELSSSFLEGILTADTMTFRAAGQKNTTLQVKALCLYLTTNGMSLSRDLAERALYISIRKQLDDYIFKKYPKGHKNWLIDNRPKIMSAIYTILKEYVRLGKPSKDPIERHRFLTTVPILNYIVTEIFGLPEITKGIKMRMSQKSDADIEIARKICFAIAKSRKLDMDLNNLDIFEILAETGDEYILGLDQNLELYADDNNLNMTNDAKLKIGQVVSKIFTRLLGKPNAKKDSSKCQVEEFIIERSYDSKSKSPRYKVVKDE